jgi:sulfur carrier protein ThiS
MRENPMAASIQLSLYATLQKYVPGGAENYPISPGTTVNELLVQLNIPSDHAKLVFIDGKMANFEDALQGGERVGIFPPVYGG